jgi:hypothetical protein
LITFRIPTETKPGTYQLMAVDPMELGENIEVRVEPMVDGKLTSFGFSIEGTLSLQTFPSDGSKLAGAKVEGSFQFVTTDADGESLSGKGTFEFLG